MFGRNAPRREPKRYELALRGLGVLVVVALVLGLLYAHSTGAIDGPPKVSADVPDAGGSLRKGSDVKAGGVIVGRVAGITRATDGGVKVSMTMDESELSHLPDNVVARILPATVFGTSFVDLVLHEKAATSSLRAGSVIPADKTQGTLELQQALNDIDAIVKAVHPAELKTAISSIAEAVQGRGQELGRIIDTADSYLGRITPQVPLLRSDLAKLADNLDTVNRIAPDLLDATRDGLVTLRTVVVQRASIAALISGGTTLARVTDHFLTTNTPQLARFLDNGAVILDALYDNRVVGITGAIKTNLLLGRVMPTISRRGWLRTEAILSQAAPPLYTRADRPTYGSGHSSRDDSLDRVSLSGMAGAR